MLSEIIGLLEVLNSDATAANMHWVDLESLVEGVGADDDKLKKQIQK